MNSPNQKLKDLPAFGSPADPLGGSLLGRAEGRRVGRPMEEAAAASWPRWMVRARGRRRSAGESRSIGREAETAAPPVD